MKALRYFLGIFLLGAGVASAQAHDRFSLGISIGSPGYDGYPAVRYLAPPPVVYHAPPMVYHAAPQVFYGTPHGYYHAPNVHRNVYRGHHFDNYRPHHGGHGHHRGYR